MAINFRYVFRSTAILARIVEALADQVATMAEDQRRIEQALKSLQAAQGELKPARRRQATTSPADASSPKTFLSARSIRPHGTNDGLPVTSTLIRPSSTV